MEKPRHHLDDHMEVLCRGDQQRCSSEGRHGKQGKRRGHARGDGRRCLVTAVQTDASASGPDAPLVIVLDKPPLHVLVHPLVGRCCRISHGALDWDAARGRCLASRIYFGIGRTCRRNQSPSCLRTRCLREEAGCCRPLADAPDFFSGPGARLWEDPLSKLGSARTPRRKMAGGCRLRGIWASPA